MLARVLILASKGSQKASENAARDEVEDMQEGSRKEDKAKRTLCEVRHALLDDRNGDFVARRARVQLGQTASVLVRVFTVNIACIRSWVHGDDILGFDVGLGSAAHDEERGCVDGGLGDEAVWCREAEQPGDEGRDAEKEEVVVEPGWFAKRELRSLSNQGLYAKSLSPTENQNAQYDAPKRCGRRRTAPRGRSRMERPHRPTCPGAPKTAQAKPDRLLAGMRLISGVCQG